MIDCVCSWSVRPVLSLLFQAIKSTKWQVKVLVCNLLKKLAAKHQLPFSRCLPIAIAPISEAMWDTKKEVKEAAAACMLVACNSVTNRDIKPFVEPLVRAIQDPTQVGETVHALSSTVFVQSVDSPALAVTVPILLRGCQEKKTEIKRKVAVIVDNMSKLIDQPREAKPFLPSLMPEIKRLGDEMSDPEVRCLPPRVPSLPYSKPSTLSYHTYSKSSSSTLSYHPSETLNLRPYHAPPTPSTFNPITPQLPETLNDKSSTLDPRPHTLTLNPGPGALGVREGAQDAQEHPGVHRVRGGGQVDGP